MSVSKKKKLLKNMLQNYTQDTLKDLLKRVSVTLLDKILSQNIKLFMMSCSIKKDALI